MDRRHFQQDRYTDPAKIPDAASAKGHTGPGVTFMRDQARLSLYMYPRKKKGGEEK